MEKEIKVSFNWVDDECASIQCPYCKKDLTVGIYKDSLYMCDCGKKFRLIQTNKIVEVIND